MKFKVEVDMEVLDHDASVMLTVPDAITDRFAGTAIKVSYVRVTKKDEV